MCRACVLSLCAKPVCRAKPSRALRPCKSTPPTDYQNLKCSPVALTVFPFFRLAPVPWFAATAAGTAAGTAAFDPPPLVNSTQFRGGDPGEQEPGLLPGVLHSPVVRDFGAGVADTVPRHRELLVPAHVALPVRVSVLGVLMERGGGGVGLGRSGCRE